MSNGQPTLLPSQQPQDTSLQHAVLLIGHGSRDDRSQQEYYRFAQMLEARLGHAVEPCFLEFADPPIIEGIRACLPKAKHIIALPLFLGPAGHQKNDVPAVINWARREWPEVTFSYGTPLGVQHALVEVLKSRAQEVINQAPNTIAPDKTALVILGRGSRDPDSNSDIAKLARLLYEGGPYPYVMNAYYALTRPSIDQSVAQLVQLGMERVVLLPHLLFNGKIYQRTLQQAKAAAQAHDTEVLVGSYLFPHSALLEAVVQRYDDVLAGTASMTCDLCKYRHKFRGFEHEYGLPQTSDASHGLRGVPHVHGDLEARMALMLPDSYQEREDEVNYLPMGAAGLVFDAEGRVAWDEMWQSFCELALAGGPTHRGSLLEAPLQDEVRAHPEAYAQVLAEITRGIGLVSNLETVPSDTLGWIGLKCTSEPMAVWLLRAIIVENVMVRRQRDTIFLPVGPAFTLHKEIKNVITVIAKTTHYWNEHILTRQQPAS